MSSVPIDEIKIGANRRPLSDDTVTELMKSIDANGLLNPITIDRKRNLIAGLHRLTACKQLGLKKIECNIVNYQDAEQARLAEIDENLIRNELKAFERSELLLERIEILERMGRRAKAGDNQHTLKGGEMISPPLKTNLEIAKEIGYSERTLQQGLQIARDTHPEVKKIIKGTAIAERHTELLKVARAGSKERASAEEAEKAVEQALAKGDNAEAEKLAKWAKQARAKQKESQMVALKSTEAQREAKLLRKKQPEVELVKVVSNSSLVKQGEEWMLGRHLVYCGDTAGKEYIKLLPSNAALAIATLSPSWNHDYLIEEAQVVAVLRSGGQIYDFCRSQQMPFQYELLLGNIYVGIFSYQSISQPQTAINIEGVEGIIAYLINLYTNPNNYVIAPFMGKEGDVLIACERTGRICFIGDENPELVRRGITRWQNLTSRQAQKTSSTGYIKST
ncbi:MAG: ParB N-terminal domain-containing protein [Cyanomargarita calcarea GSE-NOS-MK-12-04C]|uniref:ParB N-terminal domain-containing protein n=1 Tax=Cyanomargarita calcarea GSE-NOS-MK-12-04C TaxID=2839659 RepID=A0A951QT40_9CYAN|nr:ParB N-terminal domain-containing protein [Cyanomargarita calcarea GSE-NOS-MK-12-04C]